MPSRLRTPPHRPHTDGADVRPRRPQAPVAETEVALRLAIGRDGVGLEMARPVAWGCLRITEMTTRLPALRFPIDVSGGVEKFRHRRGSVTRFEMELSARAAERWCAPRLRGIVCAETPDLWVAAGPARATACAVAVVEPEAE